MRYCKNGNHRFHLRPKMVEQVCGDSGWLCPGEKGYEARRRAHKAAPKAGATRKIADKRRKPPKHRKPFREEE